jgi:hypothetical protein
LDSRTASRIAGLKEAFGWQDLTEVLEKTVEKRSKGLLAEIVNGAPLDQRKIDFENGVNHGIRILLNAPEKAAQVYERSKQEVSVE